MQAGGKPRKGLFARLKHRRGERAARTGDSPEHAAERVRAGQYRQSPVEGEDSGAVVERPWDSATAEGVSSIRNP
jgi:hypothetical protein